MINPELQNDSINSDYSAENSSFEFVWKVHMLSSEPSKLLLILPVVILSGVICYFIFKSILYLAVMLILYIIALSDYIFPIKYITTNETASARTVFSFSAIKWADVKKYYIDQFGIKLSPFNNRTKLEAYRGVYLRFGKYKDQVVDVVKRMRDAQFED